jgi:hypothetical protein
MRDPLPLDDPSVQEVAAPEPEPDLLETVRHVRGELEAALLGLEITPHRAREAARRIVGLAFLREAVGVSNTEAAELLGTSVDSIERDSALLAQLGSSQALELAQ